MFDFLEALGLHPLEWTEAVTATGKSTPYIGEILDAAFAKAGAVVVLLTPDDEARLRNQYVNENEQSDESRLIGQARPNVLFEAGMAMARSQEKTILVEIGQLRPFSDIAGRHTIRFDGSTAQRQALGQRLLDAGCRVIWEGANCQTAGDFEAVLEAVSESPACGFTAWDSSPIPSLPAKGLALLRLAYAVDGIIREIRSLESTLILVGGQDVITQHDEPSRIAWTKELHHLVSDGLIARVQQSKEVQVYELTIAGWLIGEILEMRW